MLNFSCRANRTSTGSRSAAADVFVAILGNCLVGVGLGGSLRRGVRHQVGKVNG